jgi:uncharacterized membrane protein
MNLVRLIKHRFTASAAVRRAFPEAALTRITETISASEQSHRGEIRFAVEGGLPWSYLWKNLPARSRAHMVFSKLRVWDTAENNGVLIYVLLADRHVDIVADRGLTARVPQAQWNAACEAMRDKFRTGAFEDGAVAGVQAVGALLAEHYPSTGDASNPNELSNRPAVL